MFITDDTIVAVSSAAGAAARSIVRLSGPEAIGLAGGVFSQPLGRLGGFRWAGGVVSLDRPYSIRAPARLYLFRAPRSYTRQDVVELHVPGEVIASMLRAALAAAGARPAGPGEFTARAFFSGRIDLARAEAVADVIDAEADADLRSAVGVLDGQLSRLCRPAAEALTEALAVTEASIDFADEDIELASAGELGGKLGQVAGELEAALSASGQWLPSAGRPRVAITGRPNVGKSSLLNALSGVDRAIVSALAGTTRDVLTAPAELPRGAEVLLLDAAGLAAPAGDPLARAAHAAAREAVASADAVLFVIDAADPQPQADEALLAEVGRLGRRQQPLLLANKTDLPADMAALKGRFGPELLPISAVTGKNLGRLGEKLAAMLADLAPPRGGGLLLHDRQRRGIAAAAEAAGRAAGLLAGAAEVADVAELAAVELRVAIEALGELTGEVVTEDVLAAIFSRFCIGK